MTVKPSYDRVLRADERLADISFPAVRPVTNLPILSGDLLIMAAGFEDRCVLTVEQICEGQSPGFSICMLRYLPHYDENQGVYLQSIAHRAGVDVIEMVYDRRNPGGIGDAIARLSANYQNIFIDISGMSRLLIVQVLVELLTRGRSNKINIVYGEATIYHPSEKEFQTALMDVKGSGTWGQHLSFLSSGIIEVAVPAELASVAMLDASIRMITFLSFDPEQLSYLVQEIQPAFVDLIQGVPPDGQNRWRQEAVFSLNEKVIASISGNTLHEASTLDYRVSLRILLDLYRNRNMFDYFVLAPTGSKMQAVAVGLFRAALHDVQIVYPTPREFPSPTKYTSGLSKIHYLELPQDILKLAARQSD